MKREVENLANEGYPIFTQHDLGSILELKSGNTLIIACQSNDHVSTLALVEQFAQAAKINKWEVVKLVAARQHIWRCARDLKKVLPEICLDKIPVEVAYCSDVQEWAASPLKWWVRETIIRLLPWGLYRRVCG